MNEKKYTICINRKSKKYSIRKEGYLFLSINGEWVKETSENTNKIWEKKKKRKAKRRLLTLLQNNTPLDERTDIL